MYAHTELSDVGMHMTKLFIYKTTLFTFHDSRRGTLMRGGLEAWRHGVRCSFGVLWGSFGMLWGSFGVLLGSFGVLLVFLWGACFGVLWGSCGVLWGSLGTLWDPLLTTKQTNTRKDKATRDKTNKINNQDKPRQTRKASQNITTAIPKPHPLISCFHLGHMGLLI